MKITSMNLYQVPPRWLFLEIETDEGITGWGEPCLLYTSPDMTPLLMDIVLIPYP